MYSDSRVLEVGTDESLCFIYCLILWKRLNISETEFEPQVWGDLILFYFHLDKYNAITEPH
jgi:hypothetical protein